MGSKSTVFILKDLLKMIIPSKELDPQAHQKAQIFIAAIMDEMGYFTIKTSPFALQRGKLSCNLKQKNLPCKIKTSI